LAVSIKLLRHPLTHACYFATGTAGNVRREDDIWQVIDWGVARWGFGVGYVQEKGQVGTLAGNLEEAMLIDDGSAGGVNEGCAGFEG
jgi:hypothetical protein